MWHSPLSSVGMGQQLVTAAELINDRKEELVLCCHSYLQQLHIACCSLDEQ